jgi:hypothetical protein
MPFQLRPRRPSVLASMVAVAGFGLTAAGCSHVTPLGPDAAPQPGHLRSPVVLEAMRVQFPTPPGKCQAGYAAISAPGAGAGPCYRELGAPVTFTSAVVTPYQPGNPSAPRPAGASGLLFTVPAADAAALTAVTTRAYDAQGAVEVSVDGKAWALPMALAPLTHGQFAITLPSSGQALRLERLLVPPA